MSTANPTILTTPSTTSQPNTDTAGISGGAIGGIVGGALGGLIILGTAGWLLWRRRKTSHHELAQDEVPELSGVEQDYVYMKDGGQIMELSRNEKPAEMEQPPVELDATELIPNTEHQRR